MPTYAQIAAYHHKLEPALSDRAALRAEVEKWLWQTYAPLLAKGDAMTASERKSVIDGLARYTGLKPEVIDAHELRIDVRVFTNSLLADQKLEVGRLDGRFKGPDPQGEPEQFFDPSFVIALGLAHR